MSTSYQHGELSEQSTSSATPAPTALLADRYELGQLLGRGGMSDVWRGRDVRLGREVAIKILRADLVRDESFQERFRREACHSAALNHPAIVSVYDTGETAGPAGPTPFIVMEYVHGRTLRDILRAEGRFEQQHALRIMADVCAALDFSHRNGVIHRDVKPGNIMLNTAGAVKVMDFGIARAAHDARAGMTLPSAVIGTAHYLSPEQIRGQQVDARSDVYAAGCTLYELLTGTPPFTGESPVAVTYQHLQETPPPPSTVNSAISAELDAVVLKAMTKGPANRYQSTIEMRTDLTLVLADKQPKAPKILTPDNVIPARRPERVVRTVTSDEQESATRSRTAMPYLAAIGAAAMLLFVLWQFNPFAAEPVAAIPRISGQPYMVAESELRELGFDTIERNVVPCWAQAHGKEPACDSEQYGRVLATTPTEGTKVATSTAITVDIGKAPRQFQMPSLVGKKIGEVREILEQQGLLLDPDIKKIANKDPDRSNRIVKQHPETNANVAQGDTVTLSAYERPTMVRVVDYTGKSEDAATAALTGVGFQVASEWVRSAKPEGTVVEQEPNSGKAVEGASVVIKVSDGSALPMDMPYLIGMDEQQARTELSNAGHVGDVQVSTYELSASHRQYHGLVVSTYPDHDGTLLRDDRVVLYVGEYQGDSGKEESPPGTTTRNEPSPGPTRPQLPGNAAERGNHP